MFEECSRVREMAGHMYTLACRMVVSDLKADVEFRKSETKMQGEVDPGNVRTYFLWTKPSITFSPEALYLRQPVRAA